VWPALGEHFDPTLIDPVHDAKLICPAGVVGGVQPTEFEVREEGREIVLTLGCPLWASLPVRHCAVSMRVGGIRCHRRHGL